MKSLLLLLVGLILGVFVLSPLQQAASNLRHLPIVSWIPGIGQLLGEDSLLTSTPVAPPTPAPSPTPRVIQVDMEKAQMVEKTTYSEKGITVHVAGKIRTLGIGGITILEKEVLGIVSGTCSAGIDYKTDRPSIEAVGTSASVRLSDPKIFGCGVTSVTYFDGKGIIPAPPDLYNQVFDKATQEIRNQAEQSDLVSKARESAKSTVELNLRRLGFEQVSVEIVPSSSGPAPGP